MGSKASKLGRKHHASNSTDSNADDVHSAGNAEDPVSTSTKNLGEPLKLENNPSTLKENHDSKSDMRPTLSSGVAEYDSMPSASYRRRRRDSDEYDDDDDDPTKLGKNNVGKIGGSKASNAGFAASSLAALAGEGVSARPNT
ncbi:hypothetical protein BGZ68_005707 [Mortierella alpina]|nr:hypothetical protein BGZ68_005707 [Mortierella alpina]